MKYHYLPSLLILTLAIVINSQNVKKPNEEPDSETTGACEKQLNTKLNEKNCRYGRCEQIKNGTDYACHCDKFITGRKCDRPSKDPNDPCLSNPCWGEGLCITLEENSRQFKCLCPYFTRGRFCQIKLIKPGDIIIDDVLNEHYILPSETMQDIGATQFSTFSSTNTPVYTFQTKVIETETSWQTTATTSTKSTTDASTSTIQHTRPLTTETVTKSISYPFIYDNETKTAFRNLSPTKIPSGNNPNHLISVMRQILNNTTPQSTYIPTFNDDGCNYNTCQLGKCLKNGTCECNRPAFGKYCDRIDECLILKCAHGSCVTGKGCVCNRGYTGITCDSHLTSAKPKTTQSLLSSSLMATSRIVSLNRTILNNAKSIQLFKNILLSQRLRESYMRKHGGGSNPYSGNRFFAYDLEATTPKIQSTEELKTESALYETGSTAPISNFEMTTSTLPTTTSIKKTTSTTIPITKTIYTTTVATTLPVSTTEMELLVYSTTQALIGCENGGILIDNNCICLNHFTGQRCEIPPYVDNNDAYITYMQTREPELVSFDMDRTAKIPVRGKEVSEERDNHYLSDDEIIIKTNAAPRTLVILTERSTSATTSSIATSTIPSTTKITVKTISTITTTTSSTKTITTTITTVQSSAPKSTSKLIRKTRKNTTVRAPFTIKISKIMIDSIANSISTSEINSSDTSMPNSKMAEKQKPSSDSFLEIVPMFKLSKYNAPDPNDTSRPEQIFWPWFECFPGNSLVYVMNTRKNPELKRISELNVNDKVLVSNSNSVEFSRVVNFLHRIDAIDALFIRLFYELNGTENYITLTPKHLILLGDAYGNFEYQPAINANLGSLLKYYDFSSKKYLMVKLNKKESVNLKNSGIYAPLTESGTLIVDNIVVSCYSMVKSHRLAQYFFNVLNRINSISELTASFYDSYSIFFYQIINFLRIESLFLNV